MNQIQTYLPIDRRLAILNNESLPERAFGAVLFADISGFTVMTEALSQRYGPRRGAEELSRQLNLVFSALIQQVHDFHGVVIGFSGDAITCWFAGDDGRVATSCAFRLQAAIKHLPETDRPFALKVVVVSGVASRFLIGNPETQLIEVLAGSLLDRVAAAGLLCERGELIVGLEVIAGMIEQAILAEWRTAVTGEQFAVLEGVVDTAVPDPWGIHQSLLTEIARPWLLPPVYLRIQKGQRDFLAELRPVIPLFLKFSGLAFDQDEHAGQKLDHYLRWVQSILTQYDGYVMHLTIGDKGSYLSAAFGAPLTHDEDALRAINAAIDLVDPPPEFSFIRTSRIGISGGLAWAGTFGSDRRQTYGIMGKEVNVAARLMEEAAPGQIVCTQRITELTAAEFDFDEIGSLTLKGAPQPLKVFKFAGRQRQPVWPRPFTISGRHKEQTLLNDLLADLQKNETGKTVIIEGEAGIGKSHLIAFLAHQAASIELPIFVGEADRINRAGAYHVWKPIFNQLFDRQAASAGKHLEGRRARQVGQFISENLPEAEPVISLLNPIFSLDFAHSHLVEQMSPEVRADNTNQLLLEVLAVQASHSPFVLVLDDIQWLDSSSWALLSQVQKQLEPVLLMLATRPLPPEAMPDLMKQIKQNRGVINIYLDTMPDEEIVSLVKQYLGVKELPEAVARLIQQKGEGHPFFSEELAAILVESELIQVENGICQVTPGTRLEAVAFPATIQGVMLSRLDRLAPQLQLTLKVASVIGRVFAYILLEEIYPVSESKKQLPHHLESLQKLNLAAIEEPAPGLAYVFRHILMQEVAYNMMTFAQRQRLHGRVASWYEKQHAHDLAPVYALLAYHWRLAENERKAIDYLSKAADQALQQYANQEAIRFFTEAAALAETFGERNDLEVAGWYRKIAQAYIQLDDLNAALNFLERSFVLLGQTIPHGRLQIGFHLARQIFKQMLHRIRPSYFVTDAPKKNDPVANELAKNDVAGFIFFYSNQPLWLWDTLRTLNLAEATGKTREMAKGYINLTLIAGIIGIDVIARLYQQLAWQALAEADHLETRVFVLLRDAVYCFQKGDHQRAVAEMNEGIAIAKQLGDEHQWSEHAATLASIYYYHGRFNDSLNLWQELYDVSLPHERFQSIAWSLFGQGMAHLQLGQPVKALKLLEAAQKYFDDVPDKLLASHYDGICAWAHLKKGDLFQAKVAADRYVVLSSDSIAGFTNLDPICGAVEAYLACAQQTGSFAGSDLDKLERLIRKVQRMGKKFHFAQASAHYYRGRFYWLQQKEKEAFNCWQKSIESGGKYERPFVIAQASFELARNLPLSDPNRRHFWAQAGTRFQEMGAEYEYGLVQAFQKNESQEYSII